MRPLTVINGIVLGSCLSITVSLAAVFVVFLIVGSDDPRVAHESEGLISSALLFSLMTAISTVSFYSLLKDWRSRWFWQVAMWVSLAAVIVIFLPERIIWP